MQWGGAPAAGQFRHGFPGEPFEHEEPRRPSGFGQEAGWRGQTGQRPYMTPKLTRMNFPQYAGGDALEWVQKTELFFSYQDVPEVQWVQLASFHLEDDAFQWTQWFLRGRDYVSWAEFVDGFTARFGPLEFEDFESLLQKLRQKGTVMEYRTEFEKLANRVHWEERTLSCFVYGLKDHLKDEVQAYMPRSLNHVISLARIQEERLNRQRSRTTVRPTTATPATVGKEPPVAGRPTVTRLSWSELQARKEKGLCFNCDEKFTAGHKCQKVQVFMLQQETEDELNSEDLDFGGDLDLTELGVSLHAMEGCNPSPLTMGLVGRVRQEKVTTLVNSGSTHNFIHPDVAQKVGHLIDTGATFQVMVADGSKLQCQGILKGVEVRMQGYVERTDVYLLPIRGSDMVMGVQWLQQLRRVTFDWDQMTMFLHSGKQFCLRGLTSSPVKEISLRSLQQLEEAGCLMAVLFWG
ncbi:hypothetical protein KSP39_PZI012965 [Platanthera zijinensis]|uniref:Retrotransposon gag domain-containing protein n=1 Tax=Platanthera zijinensis TaxID=2320716 RepID=A0AAP0BBI9_9ASPA